METKYIREFVVLEELRSFSKAADQLFLSQSSLSKHIRSLEKELGCQLFDRTTRRMELTEAGGIFLKFAQQISSLADASESAVAASVNRHSKALTLGIQMPQYYNIVFYLSHFKEKDPDIEVDLVESDDPGLYEMYQNHEINLFTAFAPTADDKSYQYLPLVQTKFCAIIRKDNHFAGSSCIHLKDLESEALMLPARRSSYSRVILTALRNADIVPDIVYEGSSDASIKLLKQNNNIAIHSLEFASLFNDDPDLCVLPIEPAVGFTYGLGYRDPSQLSDAENCLLDYCIDLKKENTQEELNKALSII